VDRLITTIDPVLTAEREISMRNVHRGRLLAHALLFLPALGMPLANSQSSLTFTPHSSEEILAALWTANQTGTPTTIILEHGVFLFTQPIATPYGPALLPPIRSSVTILGEDEGTTRFESNGVANSGQPYASHMT
jgi:hypothetical protein